MKLETTIVDEAGIEGVTVKMTDRKTMDEQIRRDFPLIYNHPEIAYLDNAATTQKPQMVLDAVRACMIFLSARQRSMRMRVS